MATSIEPRKMNARGERSLQYRFSSATNPSKGQIVTSSGRAARRRSATRAASAPGRSRTMPALIMLRGASGKMWKKASSPAIICPPEEIVPPIVNNPRITTRWASSSVSTIPCLRKRRSMGPYSFNPFRS